MKARFTIPLASLILASVLLAGDKAGEQINWQVISGGGTINGASASFRLTSTVAQTAAGSGNSANFKIYHGFLQDFTGETFVCGDVNNDGVVNILDMIYYIDWKFKGGAAPSILNSADVNSDGAYNILDIIYLIDYKFKGGPAPHCP